MVATKSTDNTLLLTTKTPFIGNGGIVFDNRGRMLGLIRTLPNEVTGTYFAVGIPNLCTSQSGDSDSILYCHLSKSQIWSEIDPSLSEIISTPSPLPSPIKIKCQKGKLTKYVTGLEPICPKGYKKK